MDKIITENLIALDIDLPDKAAVINEIGDRLFANARVIDREKFIKDIYAREEITSTGLEDLIAIPHARSAAVSTASLVYLRLKSPIQWNKEQQARYIFGIAVPEDNTNNIHLKILSSVARKLVADEVKQIIVESNSKQTIVKARLD